MVLCHLSTVPHQLSTVRLFNDVVTFLVFHLVWCVLLLMLSPRSAHSSRHSLIENGLRTAAEQYFMTFSHIDTEHASNNVSGSKVWCKSNTNV